MTGPITHRRICETPTVKCFRGQCIRCNSFPMKPVDEIEAYALAHGYGRDFIAGRINDFLHANVMRAV